MDTLVKVTIENKGIRITNNKLKPHEFIRLRQQLHNDIDVLVENRFHSPLFRKHVWDGKTSLVSLEGDLVLQIGLLPKVKSLLEHYSTKDNHFTFSMEDLRDNKITPNIPDKITLGDMTLREHQMDAVKAVFKHQVGIINQATSSGKSAEMFAITKLALTKLKPYERVMIVAPATSIANQLFDEIKNYVNTGVGRFYGGKRELDNQVIVATYQTLGSQTKKPKLELTPTMKKYQRFSQDYVPEIVKGNNIRRNLKRFIDNFQIKYKYQEKDLAELKEIYDTIHSDNVIKISLQNYSMRLMEGLDKTNKKKLSQYEETLTFLDSVSVILCDEIQTASSDTYQNLFTHLSGVRLRAGFTGTIPKQAEKQIKIKALFGEVVSKTTNEYMKNKGYTTPIFIKPFTLTEPKNFDYIVDRYMRLHPSNQSKDLMRYQVSYDKGVVHNDQRNQATVNMAYSLGNQEYNKGTKGTVLILVDSIEHGEILSDFMETLLQEKHNTNIRYKFIQGSTSGEERQQVFDEVRKGNIQILIATKIMDAGVSINNLKYLILVGGGKSYVQVLQRLGRLMRIDENNSYAVVIDFVDRFSSVLYKHSVKRFKYYEQEHFKFLSNVDNNSSNVTK